MATQSQNETILEHLRERGPITAADAVFNYGIMRLAARINDLRRRGHSIKTEIVTAPGRVRFARYYLEASK